MTILLLFSAYFLFLNYHIIGEAINCDYQGLKIVPSLCWHLLAVKRRVNYILLNNIGYKNYL